MGSVTPTSRLNAIPRAWEFVARMQQQPPRGIECDSIVNPIVTIRALPHNAEG